MESNKCIIERNKTFKCIEMQKKNKVFFYKKKKKKQNNCICICID